MKDRQLTTSAQKVALVTGASSGMGHIFAQRLQEAGFLVYGVARRVERMEDLRRCGIKTSPWTSPKTTR